MYYFPSPFSLFLILLFLWLLKIPFNQFPIDGRFDDSSVLLFHTVLPAVSGHVVSHGLGRTSTSVIVHSWEAGSEVYAFAIWTETAPQG